MCVTKRNLMIHRSEAWLRKLPKWLWIDNAQNLPHMLNLVSYFCSFLAANIGKVLLPI